MREGRGKKKRRKEQGKKRGREGDGRKEGGRERTFSLNAELSPSSPWKHFCLSVLSPRVTTSSSNGYFSLRSHYRRWPWRDESCDSPGSPSCTVVPPSSHLLGHTCFCRALCHLPLVVFPFMCHHKQRRVLFLLQSMDSNILNGLFVPVSQFNPCYRD